MLNQHKITFSVLRTALVLAFTMGSATLSATEVKSPESIDGTVRVSAEEFIDLVGNIPELIVIDSRIPGDRKQGYVEGSVSLPDTDTTCETLSKNIPAQTAPTLFYCNGVKCGRSVKAVKIALSCGYEKLYWFRGGFEEWLAKGYPYLQE